MSVQAARQVCSTGREAQQLEGLEGGSEYTSVEKKYDANGNGYLSPVEAKELLKDRLRLVRTHGRAKVNTPLEREFDANNDGIIDRKEAEAIKEAIKDNG